MAGQNGLKLFEGTHGCPGRKKNIKGGRHKTYYSPFKFILRLQKCEKGYICHQKARTRAHFFLDFYKTEFCSNNT